LDPTNLNGKVQKHQNFEQELTADKNRIEDPLLELWIMWTLHENFSIKIGTHPNYYNEYEPANIFNACNLRE